MKKYIFILLTSFALTSCVDLLQEPQSKLTPATIELTEQTLENMRLYYTELFAQYPDVLTATDISKVIGYGTTSINDWCKKGHLKAFKRNNVNHIPKVYLIEFCSSKYFRTITRKSDWHIRALQEFPRWQVIRGLKT